MSSTARDTTGSTLVDRLERQIRRAILERIPLSGHPQELADMELWDLVHVYGNWRYRIPSRARRIVHISPALKRSLRTNGHAKAVDAVTSAIRSGVDLSPYLSKGVLTAYVGAEDSARLTLPRRRDLDLLLSDWGLHHLHLGLSCDTRDDRFVERTRELLFVVFEPRDAYLVGVYDHDAWTTRSVVKTIARSWPERNLMFASDFATGLTQEYDEADHKELRAAGVNIAFMIDGKVYSAPGMTLAGTPMAVARNRMKLRAVMDQWRADPRVIDAEPRSPAHPHYWVPQVRGELCGVAAGDRFVPAGSLVPTGRLG